jgi:acyl-CoA thioesterase FadM
MSSFSWPYRVPIGDINYGGHMGNDRSLSLFHEARLSYLKSLGFSELNIGNNAGIIMRNAQVDFMAEIFHGDELEIDVTPGEIKGARFTLNYEVKRLGDGKTVLRGSTVLVAFDYQIKKPVPIPEEFLKLIG